MIGAAVITCLSIYLNNFVIPSSNKARLEFEETFIRNRFRNLDRNIHRQIEPKVYIYFESYKNLTNVGRKLAIEKFDGNELTYKLMADTIEH